MKDNELRELITHYRSGLNQIIRTRHNHADQLRNIALHCLTHKPYPELDKLPPANDSVEYFRSELMARFADKVSMDDIATFAYFLADMFEEVENAARESALAGAREQP